MCVGLLTTIGVGMGAAVGGGGGSASEAQYKPKKGPAKKPPKKPPPKPPKKPPKEKGGTTSGKKPKSAQDQQELQGASTDLLGAAAVTGAAATVLLAAAPVAAGSVVGLPASGILGVAGGGFALVTGALGYLSAKASHLAMDPPDQGFTVVAKPPRIEVPHPQVPDGTALRYRRVLAALNALADNLLATGAEIQALMVSINRRTGAAAADDRASERLQLDAIRTYANRAAASASRYRSLLRRVARSFRRAGVSIALRRSDLERLARQVHRHGLPRRLVRALERGPAPRTATAALRERLTSVPADVLRFPEVLTTNAFAGGVHRLIPVLNRIAARAH